MVKTKWFSLRVHIPNTHSGHGKLFPTCAHGQMGPYTWTDGSASLAYIYYLGQCSLKLCIPKKFVRFSACYGPSLLSDVQVCHQRKDTTLMVFDLILSPTLNLNLALALAL